MGSKGSNSYQSPPPPTTTTSCGMCVSRDVLIKPFVVHPTHTNMQFCDHKMPFSS